MPRDGSGVHSLDPGYLAVTGATVLPSNHNPPLEDLSAAITESIARTGVTAITADIPWNGKKITALGNATSPADALNRQSGDARYGNADYVAVASAATTDIGAASSANVSVTGTTTITALGTVSAGIFRRLRFAGALTLTHNATSLILPGGTNILTAAGDVAGFVSEGSGNWRCVDYLRASGRAVAPPQVFFLTDVTVTDFTSAIPADDTTPLSTEGTLWFTQNITLSSLTSRVKLCVEVTGAHGSNAGAVVVALFRGTTLIFSRIVNESNAQNMMSFSLNWVDSPASVSTITYNVRIGPSSGTFRINGNNLGRFLGSSSACTFYGEEI